MACKYILNGAAGKELLFIYFLIRSSPGNILKYHYIALSLHSVTSVTLSMKKPAVVGTLATESPQNGLSAICFTHFSKRMNLFHVVLRKNAVILVIENNLTLLFCLTACLPCHSSLFVALLVLSF